MYSLSPTTFEHMLYFPTGYKQYAYKVAEILSKKWDTLDEESKQDILDACLEACAVRLPSIEQMFDDTASHLREQLVELERIKGLVALREECFKARKE